MSHIFGRHYTESGKSADWFFERLKILTPGAKNQLLIHILKKLTLNLLTSPHFQVIVHMARFQQKAKEDGKKYFGERFLLVENSELRKLRTHFEGNIPLWEVRHSKFNDYMGRCRTKSSKEIVYKTDPRWEQAFDELSIDRKYLK